MPEPLEFYGTHGPFSDPEENGSLLDGLPHDLASICRAVQGLVLHPFWAALHGAQVPKEREEDLQLRSVSKMLARIQDLDDRPLTVERPLDKRLIGNCRDFTVLTCAALRHQGIPARARCGFGAYFLPGKFEDHWVCEYWDSSSQGWRLVDAELDELVRKMIALAFDPLDVPRDQFLVAGRAWQMCQSAEADPQNFGLSAIDEHGIWWVRQNLVRDLAALNKMEMLPWDGWGLAEGMQIELPRREIALLDQVATLTQDIDRFHELRDVYENEASLRVPDTIHSHYAGGLVDVHLSVVSGN
jgi:hypothetical protein